MLPIKHIEIVVPAGVAGGFGVVAARLVEEDFGVAVEAVTVLVRLDWLVDGRCL